MAENQKVTNDVFQESSFENNQNINQELNQSTSEELLLKGKALMKNEQYEEAVNILSQALQTSVEKNDKNPQSIGLLEYYLNYGKALLRLTQNSSDIFGDSIRNNQKECKDNAENYDENDENNDNKENKENEENHVNNGNQSNNNNSDLENRIEEIVDKESSEEENEENHVNNENQSNNNNSDLENRMEESINEESNEEENANEENAITEQKDDFDTTIDRELAWESLENSRVIIEEYLKQIKPNNCENELNEESKKYMSILAEVHCLLAESQMEEEIFEGALQDFEKALELRRVCNDSWRELAYIHFMSSLCATYSGKNDASKQHLGDSVKLLRDRIIQLLKSSGVNLEIELDVKENESSSNSHNEKILSHIETTLQMENVNDTIKEELKDLKQNLTDLLSKITEEENVKQEGLENEKELLNQIIQSMLQGGNNINNETIQEETRSANEEDFDDEMESGNDNDDDDNDDDNDNDVDNDNDNDNDVDYDNDNGINDDNKNNNDNTVDQEEDNAKIVNKENQHDATNKDVVYGVTTIGFSNNEPASQNEEKLNVNNLGNFGKGNIRKRSSEEANIDANPQSKKLRLSSTHIDGN